MSSLQINRDQWCQTFKTVDVKLTDKSGSMVSDFSADVKLTDKSGSMVSDFSADVKLTD